MKYLWNNFQYIDCCNPLLINIKILYFQLTFCTQFCTYFFTLSPALSELKCLILTFPSLNSFHRVSSLCYLSFSLLPSSFKRVCLLLPFLSLSLSLIFKINSLHPLPPGYCLTFCFFTDECFFPKSSYFLTMVPLISPEGNGNTPTFLALGNLRTEEPGGQSAGRDCLL